jgi:site-specific DNA-methyltransferase (adenine-specific)
MQQVGFRILNDIIWEKPAPPPNNACVCFTQSTEILLWATKAPKGRNLYTFNYKLMKAENGGTQMKNIWRMSPPYKREKKYGKHPTQKPVALVARCIRASTHAGDVILDPFAGSGTTGVAAIAEGRRFIGCELEDAFVSIAENRLKDATSVLLPG